MALEQVGIQLTVQGGSDYVRTLREAEKAAKAQIQTLQTQGLELKRQVEALKQVENADRNLIRQKQAQLTEIRRNIEGLQQSNRALRDQASAAKEASADVDKLKKSFQGLGQSVTATIAPIAAIGTAVASIGGSVRAFGDFERSLNTIKAVSGATASELNAIKQSSLELGQATVFSAQQVVSSYTELAKAGFTAQESLSAMPGLLSLAAAAGGDLQTSAEIVAGTLKGLGLDARQTGLLVDVLAQAANVSAVDITDMGNAMKQLAPVIQSTGQSFESMSAFLAILGNNAVKGADAGSDLRNILLNLTATTGPSAEEMKRLGINVADTNGKIRPLNEILDELRTKFKQMGQASANSSAEILVGKENIKSLLILTNTAPATIDKMTEAMFKAEGAAQEMANTINKGVNTSLEQFSGSVETLSIKLGQIFAPAVISVVDSLTSLVNIIAGNDILAGLSGGILASIGALGTLAVGISAVTAAGGALSPVLSRLAPLLAGLGIAAGEVVGPILLIVGAFAALGAALGAINGPITQANKALADLNREQQNAGIQAQAQGSHMLNLAREYDYLSGQTSKTVSQKRRMKDILKELTDAYPGLTNNLSKITQGYNSLAAAILKVSDIQKADAEREKITQQIQEGRLNLRKLNAQKQGLAQADTPLLNALGLGGYLSSGLIGSQRKSVDQAIRAQQSQIKALIQAKNAKGTQIDALTEALLNPTDQGFLKPTLPGPGGAKKTKGGATFTKDQVARLLPNIRIQTNDPLTRTQIDFLSELNQQLAGKGFKPVITAATSSKGHVEHGGGLALDIATDNLNKSQRAALRNLLSINPSVQDIGTSILRGVDKERLLKNHSDHEHVRLLPQGIQSIFNKSDNALERAQDKAERQALQDLGLGLGSSQANINLNFREKLANAELNNPNLKESDKTSIELQKQAELLQTVITYQEKLKALKINDKDIERDRAKEIEKAAQTQKEIQTTQIELGNKIKLARQQEANESKQAQNDYAIAVKQSELGIIKEMQDAKISAAEQEFNEGKINADKLRDIKITAIGEVASKEEELRNLQIDALKQKLALLEEEHASEKEILETKAQIVALENESVSAEFKKQGAISDASKKQKQQGQGILGNAFTGFVQNLLGSGDLKQALTGLSQSIISGIFNAAKNSKGGFFQGLREFGSTGEGRLTSGLGILASGFSGYQAAKQGGLGGVLGGGLSGALSGFSFAGPIGAVLGGAVGLAGGIFGFMSGRKAKKKAKAEERELANTNAFINNLLRGTNNDNLDSLYSTFDQLDNTKVKGAQARQALDQAIYQVVDAIKARRSAIKQFVDATKEDIISIDQQFKVNAEKDPIKKQILEREFEIENLHRETQKALEQYRDSQEAQTAILEREAKKRELIEQESNQKMQEEFKDTAKTLDDLLKRRDEIENQNVLTRAKTGEVLKAEQLAIIDKDIQEALIAVSRYGAAGITAPTLNGINRIVQAGQTSAQYQNQIDITINGVTDPEKVSEEVRRSLENFFKKNAGVTFA